MVNIRLQRTGRRRHAQFRIVVQDGRRAPTSGRVIAILGFYNPHTKEHKIDLEKAAAYLQNGAQPSARVVKFLTDQKVKLPAWVKQPPQRSDKVRYPEKLRRNRPAEEIAAEPAKAEVAAAPAAEEVAPASSEEVEQKDAVESPRRKTRKRSREPKTRKRRKRLMIRPSIPMQMKSGPMTKPTLKSRPTKKPPPRRKKPKPTEKIRPETALEPSLF